LPGTRSRFLAKSIRGLVELRNSCKNICTIRKTSRLLSALFNSTAQGVLSATILHPEKEWYLSGLATHLGVGPSANLDSGALWPFTAATIPSRVANASEASTMFIAFDTYVVQTH
jgi:hypothetical protein